MGYGIMFNEDADHFFGTRKDIADKLTKEDLEAFIDQYKDTDLTDFVISVVSIMSSVPSKIKTSYSDKFLMKEEMGIPVDYRGTSVEAAYKIWMEQKLDVYDIWIKRCHKNGIRPWIDFRMNDRHDCLEGVTMLEGPDYYERFDDLSRVRHRTQFQSFDRCRDFELEEVQETFLSYMEEILDRYAHLLPYGIELDFQREFDCFQIGHEWAGQEIMTEFMGKVKALIKKYEDKTNHTIKLAVRCHPSPEYCMELGFDILKWAELGYIDMYIASPRFRSSITDIPIKLWKQMLKPYGVEVAGAIEMYTESVPFSDGYMKPNTVSTIFGTCANFLSQGADKIYLFNYMDYPDHMITDKSNIDEAADNLFPELPTRWYVSSRDAYARLLMNAGSLDKLSKVMRRHLVNYNEKQPLWRGIENPLPCVLEDGDHPKYIRIPTGDIPKDAKCYLKLGIVEKLNPNRRMELFLNSKRLKYVGTLPQGECEYTPSTVHSYLIPQDALMPVMQVAELITRGQKITIDYAEITVLP